VIVTNSQADIRGIRSFVVTATGDNEPHEYRVEVLDLHLNKVRGFNSGAQQTSWGLGR
jgi:hypothetical protein